MKFIGDILVKRTLVAERRVDQGYLASAISAPLTLLRHDAKWQDITATGDQDVNLPDATLLPNGWEIIINAETGGNLTVKDGAGGTKQVVLAGTAAGAYKFFLQDNGSTAGVWYVQSLDNAGIVVATRFVLTHNSTSDWIDQTTFWNITTTAVTHGRGTKPMIQFYEDIGGGVLVQVQPDVSQTQTNGDNDFEVPAGSGNTPDLRYAGQVIFI